jgi:GNAT superfamily N-acetyltransferase
MQVVFRPARREDLPAIVGLLAEDAMGARRETGDLRDYEAAFDAIAAEAGNHVIVAERAGEIVATYQMTLISNLSLRAARRAQIEGVRVAAHLRGQGIGAQLMADAEARARAGGAELLQFTANKARKRAHGFYLRAGYEASHEGFKKTLRSP